MDSLPSYIDLLHFSIIDKTFTGPFRSTWVQPRFLVGSCYSIFSFICMFCRSLFVLLYFFFWPLCCLFFFDIRILINPLVSSNSSWPRFFLWGPCCSSYQKYALYYRFVGFRPMSCVPGVAGVSVQFSLTFMYRVI